MVRMFRWSSVWIGPSNDGHVTSGSNDDDNDDVLLSSDIRAIFYRWHIESSIPAVVIGFFIDIKSFRSHYGTEVDSASNRNEYQEYFPGVKAAGA